jgi:quercetin dioxygenase-like cupin family protein
VRPPLALRALAALAVFAAGVLAGVTLASPQAPPRMTARVLLDTVTEELRWTRTRVRLHLDVWEPGAETGRHQHPGPALLYVLEGELEEASAEGTRRMRAGDAVWNRARLEHNVRNPAARPARALAVHLEPAR